MGKDPCPCDHGCLFQHIVIPDEGAQRPMIRYPAQISKTKSLTIIPEKQRTKRFAFWHMRWIPDQRSRCSLVWDDENHMIFMEINSPTPIRGWFSVDAPKKFPKCDSHHITSHHITSHHIIIRAYILTSPVAGCSFWTIYDSQLRLHLIKVTQLLNDILLIYHSFFRLWSVSVYYSISSF